MTKIELMVTQRASAPSRIKSAVKNTSTLKQQDNSNQETMKHFLILLVCMVGFAWCAHDFSSYPFKATLNTAENGGLYELYWNFDNDAETISFAVRVQTTGWVGFGLSPSGQMPDSDVVIGWVTDDGETVFHVRCL